jgi:hypothetical protein
VTNSSFIGNFELSITNENAKLEALIHPRTITHCLRSTMLWEGPAASFLPSRLPFQRSSCARASCFPNSKIHIMLRGRAKCCHSPFPGSTCSGGSVNIIPRNWSTWALLCPSLGGIFIWCFNPIYTATRQVKYHYDSLLCDTICFSLKTLKTQASYRIPKPHWSMQLCR